MKIGIDATFLNKTHSGGKEQVLFNLLKGFQVLSYAENIHIFCYDYAQDLIKTIIPDAGLTVIPFYKLLRKTLTDSIFKTFRLNQLVKQNQIDVLLFPHYNTGIKKFDIPTVVIPHDIQIKTNADQFALKDRLKYGLQYHFDFKRRTKIIAISEFDRKEIEKYYPQVKSKIVQIYNPIDTDLITCCSKDNAEKPYIIAVNIAYVHKNTITLIKAFQKIMHTIPHDLVLVGRMGHETAFLKSYVNENQLAMRVRFTGFLKEDELHQVLQKSDLFVNPSLFEGFGMTAVEAAMRCVPVISSMTGASTEVSKNLFFYYQPADDAEVLADKILAVLNNRISENELELIKNTFVECYGYKKISQDYFTLLEELIHENRC